MSAQLQENRDSVTLYGRRWSRENADLSRTFDILVVIIMFIAITAAFHLHFQLTVGDWDFWVDWKDRQYWVTATPILLIAFPAALQYVFWEKFRLPIAATVCMLGLTLGIWITRYSGFHTWSYFPFSMVWPATMIAGGLILDAVLLLTGSALITAIIGGMSFGLLFYPANWPLLAPFRLPMEAMNSLVSVGDYIGYAYTRTSTPEYLRFIERGTLRTFGGHSAVVSAFFSGFVCILVYLLWWYIGMAFARVATLPNRMKSFMGLHDRGAEGKDA
ncbi:MAG: methane monooxygenase/ammonia monooxygenase subunit A [Gammaproteobacteria bacterium]|nr:methane monooxygenase/ammonia monooxygenase subunit A [Gammaproteobacteria bacterium]